MGSVNHLFVASGAYRHYITGKLRTPPPTLLFSLVTLRGNYDTPLLQSGGLGFIQFLSWQGGVPCLHLFLSNSVSFELV